MISVSSFPSSAFWYLPVGSFCLEPGGDAGHPSLIIGQAIALKDIGIAESPSLRRFLPST